MWHQLRFSCQIKTVLGFLCFNDWNVYRHLVLSIKTATGPFSICETWEMHLCWATDRLAAHLLEEGNLLTAAVRGMPAQFHIDAGYFRKLPDLESKIFMSEKTISFVVYTSDKTQQKCSSFTEEYCENRALILKSMRETLKKNLKWKIFLSEGWSNYVSGWPLTGLQNSVHQQTSSCKIKLDFKSKV